MSVTSTVIVGCGGLAREIRWVIDEINMRNEQYNLIGWIANDGIGTYVDGLQIIGNDDWLKQYDSEIAVVIGTGDGILRKRIVERLSCSDKLVFPKIIAPTAEIYDIDQIGQGAVIFQNNIIANNCQIGDFFVCNYTSVIGHDCVFGNYVTLNPGCMISGNVSLADCVTVGTGASIIQGLSVGENTTIGAGASVIRNIDKNVVAVGIPARVVKKK